MTLLADLVATSAAVTATSARSQKVALIAELLRALEPGEIEAGVGFLTGAPVQGKIGVGWATAWRVEVTPAMTASVTIPDLDNALTEVAALEGPGSSTARHAVLQRLMGQATSAEGDFIRRLLVGELRQGALEGVMADAVAKASGVPLTAVRRAVMLAGDLPRVAAVALTGGSEAVAAVGLVVLRPIKPMLASTAASVADALAAIGRASVEWKLDGIRVQAHRRGDEVRLFSRNLNDISDGLPRVRDAVLSLPCDEIVLDGETIHRGAMFFDCLHIDGIDLIDVALAERLATLDRVAGDLRIRGVVTDDADEAIAVLDSALENGHEGVVVKGAHSTYEAGRRGKAWRKVKPVKSLDLVVLAAEWGHGRRQGWLSNLHLGARDPQGGFVMVGKTFKGLTDELLKWQTERFRQIAVAEEGIVVTLRPEIVVEIALDGVHRSTRYAGGVALRFARVKRYRPDKEPLEADLISTVQAMLT